MYTPQFSDFASISVRRLAWALESTMPAAVNRLVSLLPAMYDPGLVCRRCKDASKCRYCAFSRPINDNEKTALLSL
jgi:hypothetical protein